MVLSYLAAGDDACVAALGEARAVPAVLRALEEGREAGVADRERHAAGCTARPLRAGQRSLSN